MNESMPANQTFPPSSLRHIEIIDGARYEVTSNYIGEITFLELLKQMLKRDLERERPIHD